MVCEKTDGERHLLLAHEGQAVIAFTVVLRRTYGIQTGVQGSASQSCLLRRDVLVPQDMSTLLTGNAVFGHVVL